VGHVVYYSAIKKCCILAVSYIYIVFNLTIKNQYVTKYHTELFWTWAYSLNMAQMWAAEGKVMNLQVM